MPRSLEDFAGAKGKGLCPITEAGDLRSPFIKAHVEHSYWEREANQNFFRVKTAPKGKRPWAGGGYYQGPGELTQVMLLSQGRRGRERGSELLSESAIVCRPAASHTWQAEIN